MSTLHSYWYDPLEAWVLADQLRNESWRVLEFSKLRACHFNGFGKSTSFDQKNVSVRLSDFLYVSKLFHTVGDQAPKPPQQWNNPNSISPIRNLDCFTIVETKQRSLKARLVKLTKTHWNFFWIANVDYSLKLTWQTQTSLTKKLQWHYPWRVLSRVEMETSFLQVPRKPIQDHSSPPSATCFLGTFFAKNLPYQQVSCTTHIAQ